MKIRILSFAVCHEIIGNREVDIEIVENATVSTAIEELVKLYPALSGCKDSLAVAVNAEYADGSKILKAGDEIALIPPVSGG
ncbi:MAG: molybdopterin converting factor subunit 1 [Candidatus Latescibacteria bacterium]|nr:molybdopterin converting factor subunit 1 [Candidatus Latescibacterota bacterium]